MANWTIKALLDWMTPYLGDKEIDAPRLCAEMLLAHVLGIQRIELYTGFDRIVPQAQLDTLRALVKRAGEHEPVAYLVGITEFYSIELDVGPGCLMPRPETELLVQQAIECLRSHTDMESVLDLCTGSGCIAVAIAKNHASSHLVATDLSEEAITMADRNIRKHQQAKRIELIQGDLFDPVESRRFDLIISNPPYVTTTDYTQLDTNVRDYEPRLALDGGPDGLDVYRRILARGPQHLKDNGILMLEIGYNQGSATKALFKQAPLFTAIDIHKDLQGHDRIIVAST